jgi:hypothetical protein
MHEALGSIPQHYKNKTNKITGKHQKNNEACQKHTPAKRGLYRPNNNFKKD